MQQRMFSRRRLLLRVVAFGLTAICTGFFARFAQAQLIAGDVIGTVTDMSGAVIPVSSTLPLPSPSSRCPVLVDLFLG
jgi:hypothetical protein